MPPAGAANQTILHLTKSRLAFERSQKVIPGGVNSPVRSCKAVNSTPVFIAYSDGSNLWDIDGNQYIDYVGAWGPMIVGHRHPRVLEALEEALLKGTAYGAPCLAEIELAELISRLVPSMEMVRMVNSGTEATMSAVRLARAFTKRSLIIKFDGCYHGHADSFLVKAGSGLATLGIASSPGVPEELSQLTISLPYNDLSAVEKASKEHGDKVAAIIVEPVVGNSGVILPKEGFLSGLRNLATKMGALLVFDEVMTGFRVALNGAQGKFGIRPDLTCLGKIIGGGLPVGAYGGRKDIMEMVAPSGPVYQAGTLSGSPLAMAAGIAQLKLLQAPQIYQTLETLTNKLADGLKEIAKKTSQPCQVVSITGMVSVFFTKEKIVDFASAQTSDTSKFARTWQTLMDKGVYWPPSQFESAFVSLVHSQKDIEETLAAFQVAMKA
ncbi:MAG: glutamate-1-semialdehyde 2,1-aminomutase [Candidatus Melainabacteria bacterium]|nr:glutamate-1-semialdehyde 2,1-aminomutase [Candidatus Melainabacteria bacterium]